MPDSKTVAAWVSCGCSDCRLRLENLTLQAENARLRDALGATHRSLCEALGHAQSSLWNGVLQKLRDTERLVEAALREGGPDV